MHADCGKARMHSKKVHANSTQKGPAGSHVGNQTQPSSLKDDELIKNGQRRELDPQSELKVHYFLIYVTLLRKSQ